MSDRGKIMSWLEGLAEPDWRVFHSDSEVQNIAKSALAMLKEDCHNCKLECLLQKYDELKEKYDELLKEQEAVIHPEPSCEMTYITDCCCDLCGVQLIREDNFCRCCGKRIEWEGR